MLAFMIAAYCCPTRMGAARSALTYRLRREGLGVPAFGLLGEFSDISYLGSLVDATPIDGAASLLTI